MLLLCGHGTAVDSVRAFRQLSAMNQDLPLSPARLMSNPEEDDGADEGEEEEPAERDPTGRYSRYDHVLGRGAFKTGVQSCRPEATDFVDCCH